VKGNGFLWGTREEHKVSGVGRGECVGSFSDSLKGAGTVRGGSTREDMMKAPAINKGIQKAFQRESLKVASNESIASNLRKKRSTLSLGGSFSIRGSRGSVLGGGYSGGGYLGSGPKSG